MKKFILETPITKITLWSFGSAIGIMIGGGALGNVIFDGNQPLVFTKILIILMIIATSFAGIASIIKREAPGGIGGTIKGPMAVISAGFLLVLCAAALLLVLFSFFFDFLN